MKIPAALLLLVLMTSACGRATGGFSSREGGAANFPTAQPASGAFVIVPADSRVFSVQVLSKQEDLQTQLSELTSARDAVLNAIKPVGEMTAFQVGDPVLYSEYSWGEKRDKAQANAVMLRISFKIPADPLKQVSQFVKAIEGIKQLAGSRLVYSLRGMEYALSSPESHREKLVAKAIQDLRGLRDVDTSQFKVNLTGLEKPLAVAQHSENQFLVSLQYTVTVESMSGHYAGTNTTSTAK